MAVGMRQNMVGETGDSILVKEGRVEIALLFHSSRFISQCSFYQNIMIPYTLKIYEFLLGFSLSFTENFGFDLALTLALSTLLTRNKSNPKLQANFTDLGNVYV